MAWFNIFPLATTVQKAIHERQREGARIRRDTGAELMQIKLQEDAEQSLDNYIRNQITVAATKTEAIEQLLNILKHLALMNIRTLPNNQKVIDAIHRYVAYLTPIEEKDLAVMNHINAIVDEMAKLSTKEFAEETSIENRAKGIAAKVKQLRGSAHSSDMEIARALSRQITGIIQKKREFTNQLKRLENDVKSHINRMNEITKDIGRALAGQNLSSIIGKVQEALNLGNEEKIIESRALGLLKQIEALDVTLLTDLHKQQILANHFAGI